MAFIEALIAVVVFLITYALIVDERINRAVAAMAGAAVLVFLGIVPWENLLDYVDFGTIFLLMGMMIIVNVASNSGLFEYLAIITAKAAKGSPIMVLVLFSCVTAVTSAFLDNVTTVLLMTPMLLYIAKVMDLNPIPFLLAEVLSSNVGGMATLIGDPPNIMIASAAGLTFNEFLLTMAPIAIVDLLVILVIFYVIYGRKMKVDDVGKAAIKKTIDALDERAAIQDTVLFKKSIIALAIVIMLFFMHNNIGEILHTFLPFVDSSMTLEPAEVALIGAALILFWSRKSPEVIFEKVEWTALFFFGGLFILVGGLVETGVINDLALMMTSSLTSTGEAMFVIAWFSAIASAIVDNIPLTAALIPLIQDIGVNTTSIDIYPLWWALSLGACLGGNGTAIAASANVVVLGIAEREGIKITFFDFLKIGMFVLVITVAIGLGMLYIMF
jgi:Na+/H+ antiporter NhaD/arsenite permease-like protein